MARRRPDYQTWGSGFVIGLMVGCAATFLYLQIAGVCQ
jgi:hypothetical protein